MAGFATNQALQNSFAQLYKNYCNFAHSALTSFRMGISELTGDLLLAEKIEVGVAAGTLIDDGGKVVREIVGTTTMVKHLKS